MENSQISKNSLFGWGLAFFILIAVDQFVKYKIHNPFQNANFVFSLSIPQAVMFFVYAAVLFFILFYCAKNFKKFSQTDFLAWTLVLSGAVSNVGERLATGAVKDYIYILNGIFNLADAYIILGIIILLMNSKKQEPKGV